MRKKLLVFIFTSFWTVTSYASPVRMADGSWKLQPSVPRTTGSSEKVQTTGESFVCDGRQFCSQMRSCAEAKFFLKNCPTTKMDGDTDGIPCEQQWCR